MSKQKKSVEQETAAPEKAPRVVKATPRHAAAAVASTAAVASSAKPSKKTTAPAERRPEKAAKPGKPKKVEISIPRDQWDRIKAHASAQNERPDRVGKKVKAADVVLAAIAEYVKKLK